MAIDPEEYLEKAAEFLDDLKREKAESEISRLNAMSVDAPTPLTEDEKEEFADLWAEDEFVRLMMTSGQYSLEDALKIAPQAVEKTRVKRKRAAELQKRMQSGRLGVYRPI